MHEPIAMDAGAALEPAALNGIVVLDKPRGLPSARVLEQLKRMLGLRGRKAPKAGFLGTLDPLATGVLPVFLGKATRLISAFEGQDKTYRATLRLGQRTDTFDADGKVLEERDPSGLEASAVRAAVEGFRGCYAQAVPSYSAVKVDGVPAYKLARAGQAPPDRQRTVTLHQIELEALELPYATVRLTCTAGTYVRSLAEELGQRLGVGAHVAALRRLSSGELFTLENSITLDGIEEALARGDRGFVQNPTAFLPDYLPLTVEDDCERQLRDGRTIPLPPGTSQDAAGLGSANKAKALRPCGTLLAIGTVVRFGAEALGFQPSKVLI